MFKRIHYNREEGMIIKVKTGDELLTKVKEVSPEKISLKKEGFACEHCDFIAKSKLGLISHNRKHK